jgi:hypothetical protein
LEARFSCKKRPLINQSPLLYQKKKSKPSHTKILIKETKRKRRKKGRKKNIWVMTDLMSVEPKTQNKSKPSLVPKKNNQSPLILKILIKETKRKRRKKGRKKTYMTDLMSVEPKTQTMQVASLHLYH